MQKIKPNPFCNFLLSATFHCFINIKVIILYSLKFCKTLVQRYNYAITNIYEHILKKSQGLASSKENSSENGNVVES